MKKISTLFFFLHVYLFVFAQLNVPPCPLPGTSYSNAPLIDCCLNGYHYASLPGGGTETPNGFCGPVESGQWLAFQVERYVSEMEFSLDVENCSTNAGVDFQVFGIGANCSLNALFPVSSCVHIDDLDSLSATNLVPGHVYYILIDGVQGEICEYTLSVLNKVKTCTPPAPTLSGPTMVDAGQTHTYTLVTPPDTCLYEIHNPCNNTNQDTVSCAGFCNDTGNSDTTWTGPPGAVVTPIPGTLSADVTFGFQSGFVTVVITGPCNNISASIFVYVCNLPPPAIPSFSIITCNSPAILLVSGNYVDYAWSNGFHGNPLVTYSPGTYEVVVTDAAGCTSSNTVSVGIANQPLASINGPAGPICAGETASLAAVAFGTPPLSYTWSNNMTGPNITGAPPGSYTVTVTDGFGCTDLASFDLTAYPYITSFLPALTLCQDDLPYDFFGTSVTASGNYQETLSSYLGCDSTVMQSITVVPAVALSLQSSVGNMIPQGGSALLDAGSGFSSYLWSDNTTAQTLSTTLPGTYAVTVSNAQGCTASASITLVQLNACPLFNLPVAPADSCHTAPPFCANYLNGYCSSNDAASADLPGNLSQALACSVENNQWLSFVADNDTVRFVFSVNDCASATGLEFSVLQSADCLGFTAFANCYPIASGLTDTLTVVGLDSCQAYYLMVDGIGGDRCGWQILQTSGVSDGMVLQEQNTPGQVTGPDHACAGSTASFSFTGPVCDLIPVSGCQALQQLCLPHPDTCVAVQYDTVWHVSPAGTVFVNNDSTGLVVTVAFPDTLPVPASGTLEFTVSVELVPITTDTLPCWDDCMSPCVSILPDSVGCLILPKKITVCAPDNITETFTICPGQCVTANGQTYCQPGVFTTTTTDLCGCTDSYTAIVDWIQDLTPLITPPQFSCDAQGASYTVSFEVFGFGSTVLVDGQFLPPGTPFVSAPIPSGQSFGFTVETLGNCSVYSETVGGTHDCPPCQGGIIDLATVTVCPSECFDLLGNPYCGAGSYEEILLDPLSNCLNTYLFTIVEEVESQLAVGPVTELCDVANLTYTVGFSIVSGVPPYQVNGNLISGNFYQSNTLSSGDAYAFTVTDAATCAPQPVSVEGSFTCSCLSSPGTMALAHLYQCEGLPVNAAFNNDAVVNTGDALVFVLHTSGNASLGTVVGVNTTGGFGFDSGSMTLGTTYYISPAVGPDLGGTVDFNAACFSLAPGQPVTFYSAPTTTLLPPDTLNCIVGSVMLNALANGGSGNIDYLWTGPGNFNSTVPNPMVSLPGNYGCTATDPLTGCSAYDTTTVHEDIAPPVFTLNTGTLSCTQPTVELIATSPAAGVGFTWSLPSGDNLSGDTILTNMPGTYAVVALAPNGCTAEQNTAVTGNTAPNIQFDLESKPPTCFGYEDGYIKINNISGGTPPYQVTINGEPVVDLLDSLAAGEYTVVVTDAAGCVVETLIELPAPPAITVDIGDDQFLTAGDSLTLVMVSNIVPDTIIWTDPDGNIWEDVDQLHLLPTGSGKYSIVISDVNSCRASDEVFITVSALEKVFIPSAFSPNGDNRNDVFMVYSGSSLVDIVSLKIFDRWGNMVFSEKDFLPNDPAHAWDGKLNGKEMDPAVFVYMAEVRINKGETRIVSGDLLLLK